jgi:hypothetical protein
MRIVTLSPALVCETTLATIVMPSPEPLGPPAVAMLLLHATVRTTTATNDLRRIMLSDGSFCSTARAAVWSSGRGWQAE